ncbi:MAG: acetyl-CoA hydrolase/transferase family protein [Anaerotignum sp.]
MSLNRFYQEYQSKLKTPEEAVRVVKDGDWVDYGTGVGMPYLLDYALAKRRGELKDVKVRGNLVLRPLQIVEQDRAQETFTYQSWHCSGYERKLCDEGLCYYTPMLFRNETEYYRKFLTVNVAMISVAPMDRLGYFSFSLSNCTTKAIVDVADIVILEVDENLPNVYGGKDDCIHISEVDFVVEGEHPMLSQLPVPKATEIDQKIAHQIMPHLFDGAVVQLGIGGMPNSVGNLIAESDLKHLGMHTELLSDAFVDLYEAGKLDNSRKTLHKDKGVFGIALGSQRLYDWVADNRGLISFPMDYVNSPDVMAQMDGLISINSCIGIDLYGQVSSESSGVRHISGTGGQLDFTTGAFMSPGGKGFICLASTFTDKAGQMHSRILPKFTGGDIITTPRTQAYYIVSEYGCVNLAGRSTWERAEMIISLAHPDFRDDLIKEAQKQNIWRRSNR